MQTNKESIQLGGYDTGWPIGSLFKNEGERLMQLVIEQKPEVIVEIGTRYGCSTAWLAEGCRRAGYGHVYSFDIDPEAGSMIPIHLMPYVTLFNLDALETLPEFQIDLLFEDGEHDKGFTRSILQNWKAKTVVVHDFFHRLCIDTVQKEFLEVLGEPDEVHYEPPSDCGLAIKYCDYESV